MKWFLLAAVATGALSAPAAARDHNWYMGIEGGLLWAQDLEFDGTANSEGPVFFSDYYQLDFKTGLDIDVIGGYDFGFVRTEVEFGYKTADIDEVGGLGFTEGSPIDGDGSVRVKSVMANALIDFGNEDGFSVYGGGGLGLAEVKVSDSTSSSNNFSLKDSGLAWQLIAGVRYAVWDNVQMGLKYRYFQGPRIEDNLTFSNRFSVDLDSNRFRSHSLLFSVIYHAGEKYVAPPPPPPAPPPPPPLPPPATQTCPDGSVILATDACPPPPPPPPPMAEPERG